MLIRDSRCWVKRELERRYMSTSSIPMQVAIGKICLIRSIKKFPSQEFGWIPMNLRASAWAGAINHKLPPYLIITKICRTLRDSIIFKEKRYL